MRIGYLRSLSSQKFIFNLCLIFTGYILSLVYRNNIQFYYWSLPKELVTPNPVAHSWSEFVPINKNSPFQFLEYTHHNSTAYLYQEILTSDMSKFCETKLCVKGLGKNKYPIPLKNYFGGFCETDSPHIFKRDDDTLVTNQVREQCIEQCRVSSCCLCGELFGEHQHYGMKKYFFPAGLFYYINEPAKKVLCNQSQLPSKILEDHAFGLLLSLKCDSITPVHIDHGIYHRQAHFGEWEFELVKMNNH